MSRPKTVSAPKKRPAGSELTLEEALERVDPVLAESLSVFYAQLARAHAEGDREGVEYVRQSIAEAMRGVPEGEIDMPLMEALGQRDAAAKPKKRGSRRRAKST